MKLGDWRNCRCGCRGRFRVREDAPWDSNHSYASLECRHRVEGDPTAGRFYQRMGVDPERRRQFFERIDELLTLGLSHREVVEQLMVEGLKTGGGRTPTVRHVTNHIERTKAMRKLRKKGTVKT